MTNIIKKVSTKMYHPLHKSFKKYHPKCIIQNISSKKFLQDVSTKKYAPKYIIHIYIIQKYNMENYVSQIYSMEIYHSKYITQKYIIQTHEVSKKYNEPKI